MAILTVDQMTSTWKKRLTSIAAATALTGVATACASDSDDDATAAIEADAVPDTRATNDAPITTTAPETTVEQVDPVEEAPLETDAPTTTVEPEPAGVDIASFEAFTLPDYAAAAVSDEFSSYFVEVEPGIRVHVLEVGSGYPVYLQHGAPTSGFLYRKIAELLPPDQFRVIMPTMVGLGFSTKVSADQHTLDNHARWMNEALGQLELDELIYVGHDWGGPVGMGALERSPDLMQGAVVLNTAFGAPTGPVEFNPQLAGAIATPAEVELVVADAIFDQIVGLQNDPSSLPTDVVDLYRRPVADSDDPIAPLAIIRMAADGPEHPTAAVLRDIDNYIAQLDVPSEIVWGTNDPFLGERLDEIVGYFPEAPVTRTEAGHFLQEEVDAPEAIAAAIQRVHDQIES